MKINQGILVFSILILFLISVSLAQSTTDFGDYCISKCNEFTTSGLCKPACISSGEEFQGICLDLCIKKGINEDTCALGCKFTENTRNNLRACFSSCTYRGASPDSCSEDCRIPNYLRALGLAEKENISDFTKERIERVEKVLSTGFSNWMITAKDGTIRRPVSGSGNISLGTEDGKRIIRISVNLSDGETLESMTDQNGEIILQENTIRLALRTKTGEKVANLIFETDGVIGRDGIAFAEVKKIRMKLNEIKIDINEDTLPLVNGRRLTSSGRVISNPGVSVSVDVNLLGIPEDTSMTVKPATVSKEKLERFKQIAKAQNLQITETALAVEIDKGDWKNDEHIESAKIIMKIDKDWVESIGGVKNIRIMREDEGFYEILETIFVGEEDGLFVFEGISPNGLSLYALVTVAQLEPVGPGVALPTATEPATTPIGTGGTETLLFVVVGIVVLVVAGSYVFLGQTKKKKK